MTHEVRRLPDAHGLAIAGANAVLHAATEAVHHRGVFRIALAGGATPRQVYSLLTRPPRRERVPWNEIDFFWSDERHVPPSHPDSNYRMAYETLLSKVPVNPERVHRVHGEDRDAAAAAAAYEAEVRATADPAGGIPQFDLILLGLGADGHTASLFPGTNALAETSRLVAALRVESVHAARSRSRITMTLPLINAARQVIFIVSGADKARAVRDVLAPQAAGPLLPAQLVGPAAGRQLWLVDEAAASLLQDTTAGIARE
jgi:6-phosphogluconolactonase